MTRPSHDLGTAWRGPPAVPWLGLASAWAWASLMATASGHEHHTDDIPKGHAVSDKPLATILWIHIGLQTLAFGIIFPVGMVLGITRSRWHVPLQSVGALLAIAGYILGHTPRGGRQFQPHNIHARFAVVLMAALGLQIVLGVYLRLHWERGVHGAVRRWVARPAHGVVGKTLPLLSWTQMVFGAFTALGFCQADHVGQCVAHFVMGSAFVGYGVLLTLALLVGQRWLRRTGRSQEFFDSGVIAAWGLVNTFTEHRWGSAWVGNDLQHTTMGVVWWCAGLVGLWLARGQKRTIVPALVIILTGYAMSGHPQHLPLSTMVHAAFGYTLMAAGLARLVEIAFLLRDRPALDDHGAIGSFQHLPPFLLYASGFLFMGATEEQMKLVSDAGVTHVSYILMLYSVAFIMFLFVHILIHLSTSTGRSAVSPSSPSHAPPTGTGNGNAAVPAGSGPQQKKMTMKNNGQPLRDADGGGGGGARGVSAAGARRRAADAEEFELEALIEGDEEELDEEDEVDDIDRIGDGDVVRIEAGRGR
ncbi:MAG: hypothetical protein M1826_003513 [Phylliscum demangeonii]|nr:MAG: hypothetical protein M1826_003513 [Phylliscum demangeonii]